jgi:hypothetical protein
MADKAGVRCLDFFSTRLAPYRRRLRSLLYRHNGYVLSSSSSGKDCGHQSTVTAGTLFDKTRTPLSVWLAAAWYLTHQKQGVSALGLQRVLGLGSYQTAWARLHRFRRARVRPTGSV